MVCTGRRLTLALVVTACGTLYGAPPAVAGMIGTDEAIPASQASAERARVKTLVARPEVARQLQALGVSPQNAAGRVDAMTNQEVHALANRIDSLPAGGNFTDFQWVMIIIGVVIIALLV
jgi:hypothetical protein